HVCAVECENASKCSALIHGTGSRTANRQGGGRCTSDVRPSQRSITRKRSDSQAAGCEIQRSESGHRGCCSSCTRLKVRGQSQCQCCSGGERFGLLVFESASILNLDDVWSLICFLEGVFYVICPRAVI